MFSKINSGKKDFCVIVKHEAFRYILPIKTKWYSIKKGNTQEYSNKNKLNSFKKGNIQEYSYKKEIEFLQKEKYLVRCSTVYSNKKLV